MADALIPAWRETLTRAALKHAATYDAVEIPCMGGMAVGVQRMLALLAVVEAAENFTATHADDCLCVPCVVIQVLKATP